MKKISIYLEDYMTFDAVRKDLPEGLAWSGFMGIGCGIENSMAKEFFKVEFVCDDDRCDECVDALINLFKIDKPEDINFSRPEGQDQGIITVETIDRFLKIKDFTTWT